MPSFCFLSGVSLAANQTSVVKQIPPGANPLSFQVTTRTAAGVQVLTPTTIPVLNRRHTFFRIRWVLATTTVHVEGSNTQKVDEWESVGSLVIVVGIATLLYVTLG